LNICLKGANAATTSNLHYNIQEQKPPNR